MLENLHSIWEQCQADTRIRRAMLYGLALLRSIHPLTTVTQVLSTGKSQGRFKQRFDSLCEDYPSIFSDDTHQSLHPEVRTFLRNQLLAQRHHPEIMAVITHILQNQQTRMEFVEAKHTRLDVRTLLRDGSWSLVFLDLLEAQLWSHPTQALSTAIPFLLAASLHQPEHILTIHGLVIFFEDQIDEPSREWWLQICQGFNLQAPIAPLGQMAECLCELRSLLLHKKLVLAEPFAGYQHELLAALWWQEGELFREVDLQVALPCYHEALHLLYAEKDVPQHLGRLYWVLATQCANSFRRKLLTDVITYDPNFFDAYVELGYICLEQKEYKEAQKYYHYAIELQPRHVELWVTLGVIHTYCKDYHRALDELNHAVLLHSAHFLPYYNRANVHVHLQQYQEALADYNTTLELDSTFAAAYINRGNVYSMIKQPEQAKRDYEEAWRLQPREMQALWLYEWIRFGRQRITPIEARRLLNIAEQDASHYLTLVCRGIFTGVTQRDLKLASKALEAAYAQEPDQWDPPFWLGMVYAYRNLQEQAVVALEQALILGLPVALLLPLYWLEKDNPDFFQKHALPILQRYDL